MKGSTFIRRISVLLKCQSNNVPEAVSGVASCYFVTNSNSANCCSSVFILSMGFVYQFTWRFSDWMHSITMANRELVWDHSIGENLVDNSLLDDSQSQMNDIGFFTEQTELSNAPSSGNFIQISKRQLSFILRSLDEASSVLHEQSAIQQAHNNDRRGIRREDDCSNTTRPNKCKSCLIRAFNIVTKYNLVVTIILQLTMMITLTILDSTVDAKHLSNGTDSIESCLIMLSLMAVNLLLIIYITFRITKQMIHQTSSLWQLAEAYLSTVIVFGGAYTVTYRLDKASWTLHGFQSSQLDKDPVIAALLFLEMLYHSISTSTLCGASIIHPTKWFNFILMAIQMLLSFVYFTSILSETSRNFPRKPSGRPDGPFPPARRRVASFTSLNSTMSERTRLLHNSSAPTSNGGTAQYGGL